MIRFKKDDGTSYPEWQEKTFEDIGKVSMCKRVLKEQTSESGDIPFFKIGTFGGEPDAFISKELYEELKNNFSFPKKGNVLLSASGTIGRTVVYKGEDAFYQDSNIVWIEHDDSVIDEYLYQYYKVVKWQGLEGSTIKRLYNKNFLVTKILLPCLEEQQKIADFLSSVDEVIAESEKEIANLEAQKKSVMQKIFSQEVRFKADDSREYPEWKEKRLEEITDRVIVGLASSVTPYYRVSGIPILRNLNIKENKLDDSDLLYLDEEYANKQDSKKIRTGDILTVHTGYIGISCLVPEKYNNCLTFTTLITTVNEQFSHNRYLTQFLNSAIGMDRITGLTTTGGRNNLNTKDFVNLMIPCPCLEEQQKIADFLSNLDTAIEEAKKELECWKQIKKGLLQQMFV